MTEQENSTGAIVIIGLLAVLLPCGAGFQLLSAGIDPFLTMIVTFVIFVGGLFGAIKLQPKDKIYTLRISSNSGEQRLLQTGDKVFANHVTKAVQSAISR